MRPGRSEYAILNDKNEVVPAKDVNEWAKFFENVERRRIASEKLEGGVLISTVFLGLNHGWGDEDLWFETMIFDGPLEGYQWRCETYEQALKQHSEAVRQAKAGVADPE